MSEKREMVVLAPPEWGPWLGVPEDKMFLCAVADCDQEGHRQICFADGRLHHHGCVHYDAAASFIGLLTRKGWGYLCDSHYAQLEQAQTAMRQARQP